MESSAVVGIAYLDTVVATDPEGQAITYTKLRGPAAFNVNPDNGIITYTPVIADTNSRPISIVATDILGSKDTLSWNIYIQGWRVVGNASFSTGDVQYTSLWVDNTGIPYVGYRDNSAAGAGKGTVMKCMGNAWSNVGTAGFTDGTVTYTSLAFDNTNAPFLAFRDSSLTSQFNVGRGTVQKWNSLTSSWELVGTRRFTTARVNVTYVSFCIDGVIPYVAYSNGANTGTAMYGTPWATLGNNFSANPVSYVSIKTYNGIQYVTFSDGGNSNGASAMKYSNSAWSQVGSTNFSSGRANYVSQSIDATGTIYVAYQDVGNNNGATVMKYSGSAWASIGGTNLSGGQANYTSLFVYQSTPYLAYQDVSANNKATIKKFNGTSWQTLGSGIGGASTSTGTEYVSLYVYQGTPYIAFRDVTTNRGYVMVFK
jgi:hypothetical protein